MRKGGVAWDCGNFQTACNVIEWNETQWNNMGKRGILWNGAIYCSMG